MNSFERLQSLIKTERVTPDLQPKLEKELWRLECDDDDCNYVLRCYDELTKQNKKTANKNNAVIFYVLGLTDEIPKRNITQSPTTLPDIDYDTDSRDEIKKYLVDKDKVSLLGTYNTLKVKGALKEVTRQVREMNFEEVNKLNKKFDSIKRTDEETIKLTLTNSPNAKEYEHITDYNSEIAFYYASLEFDKDLKKWFTENQDVADAVTQLLGNAKSTGIHAGGIVVSGVDIKNIVALTYDKDEEVWVTQPEMLDVEAAGLIKYDFLGLKTGAILNNALKLVNKRHGTKHQLSNIPLSDKDVLEDFKKGLAISVFQFDTDLVQPNLLKLNSVDSVIDLAMITSIYRPGPLKMKMDQSFIKRKNGVEKIEYLHPALEPHIKATYGIFCFQEQIMTAVIDLGGISPSDSVVVLKAMGKKDKNKLSKYHDKFVKNCLKKYKINDELANKIWEFIEAFALYGFNKCLTGDTKVILESGNKINIEDFKNIDFNAEKVFLKSYNPENGKVFKDRCLEFIDSGIQEVFEVTLDDSSIVKCTMDHEFVCSDNNKHKLSVILAEKLEILKATDINLKTLKISSIKSLGKQQTYCLRMESDSHNFLINDGIVSGNSHAIAYGITSYLCMWLKHYYPLEWINSVLMSSEKDDFKLMYQHWSSQIQRPDVNKSKETYFIDDEAKKVTMPFTSVNGIGDAAVKSMIAAQPFTSFNDFYDRIDKRKVNKKCVLNLIMSGSFDQFKIPEVSDGKWRKHLVKEFVALRHKEKKPSKAQKEEDDLLIQEVESMTRGRILMKEVELLNFTSFNYHEYFKEKMTTYCKSIFGREAMKPKDALGLPNKTPVVVGGAIESIETRPIKSGKFIGKDRMIIRLVNEGDSVEVVIMPWVLELDDQNGGGSLRKLTPYTPIIVKGEINVFHDFYSISFKEGMTLV
jgi:DNA polymerase III alpha subunit